MTLQVLGSSSAGNCYLFKASNGTLIVDAGIPLTSVKRALGWQISSISGVLVSHSHGDHAKHLAKYAMIGMQVYALQETIDEALTEDDMKYICCEPQAVEFGKQYAIGPFRVIPIKMVHDVACAGYIIYHPEMGMVVFATDTEYVPQIVKGCNHLMVECNYADDIVLENIKNHTVPQSMRKRLLHTHCEEKTAMKIIDAYRSADLCNVILLHLSPHNSSAERFLQNARKTAGVPVYVAQQGVEIELMK